MTTARLCVFFLVHGLSRGNHAQSWMWCFCRGWKQRRKRPEAGKGSRTQAKPPRKNGTNTKQGPTKPPNAQSKPPRRLLTPTGNSYNGLSRCDRSSKIWPVRAGQRVLKVRRVSKVIVFTASAAVYADKVLDVLDPGGWDSEGRCV